MPGRIIVLNGTSSSGKSTLVRSLQAALPELWLEMGIDRFAYALPGRVAGELTWPLLFRYVRPGGASDGPFRIETTPLGHRFIAGIGATAATLAGLGLNVIVDHVLLERKWVEECRRRWADYDVLWVGVRCALEVVVERERQRESRTLGQAAAQFDRVHRWTTYDVEVDTSILDPEEAAERILATFDQLLRDRAPGRGA